MSSSRETNRPLRAMHALHRVRDVEDRQAQGRLHIKQKEIQRLKTEIENLKRRRGKVLDRQSGHVLRERLLVDALMKITLERGRELEALHLQAAVLLSDCRVARSRRDSAASLRDRRQAQRNAEVERRADEFTHDLVAARRLRARIRWGDGASQETQCDRT